MNNAMLDLYCAELAQLFFGKILIYATSVRNRRPTIEMRRGVLRNLAGWRQIMLRVGQCPFQPPPHKKDMTTFSKNGRQKH